MNEAEYVRKRSEYEQIVLRELRTQLLGSENHVHRLEFERPRIRVEDIRFDASDDRNIMILFRDLDRAECLFGYCVEALEHPQALEEEFDDRYTLRDAAEVYAGIVAANWEEEIYADGCGLPAVCYPEGINWVPPSTT